MSCLQLAGLFGSTGPWFLGHAVPALLPGSVLACWVLPCLSVHYLHGVLLYLGGFHSRALASPGFLPSLCNLPLGQVFMSADSDYVFSFFFFVLGLTSSSWVGPSALRLLLPVGVTSSTAILLPFLHLVLFHISHMLLRVTGLSISSCTAVRSYYLLVVAVRVSTHRSSGWVTLSILFTSGRSVFCFFTSCNKYAM